jgi:Domain of unknown function (DUF5668)
MDANQQPERSSSFRPGVVAAGGILLALGVAMLLDTTGAIDIRMGRLIAPLVLISLGAAMMLDKGGLVYGRRVRDADGRVRTRLRTRGSQGGGLWLIGIGSWMMVSQMHLFGLNYANSWPLFIILSGVLMVIRGTR